VSKLKFKNVFLEKNPNAYLYMPLKKHMFIVFTKLQLQFEYIFQKSVH